jgi:hypothetical protein
MIGTDAVSKVKVLIKNSSKFTFLCQKYGCRTKWPVDTGYICPKCNTTHDHAKSNYQLKGLIK